MSRSLAPEAQAQASEGVHVGQLLWLGGGGKQCRVVLGGVWRGTEVAGSGFVLQGSGDVSVVEEVELLGFELEAAG